MAQSSLKSQPDSLPAGMFANPVWRGADPWITKVGHLYVGSRSAHNGIVVSRSLALTKPGESKTIWTAPQNGWNRSCVWAPEIHFLQGRWYVYYAAGESGPPFIHQRTGVLRSANEDPFSAYEEMGQLYTGDHPEDPYSNIWAIDMTLFEYRGNLYAVWSGWEKQEKTDATSQHLYLSKMSNPYTLTGKRVKLSSPVEPWETGGPLNLNEGPEPLQHNGKLFIVYSCRESWLVSYRLGLLELVRPEGDLLDPASWKKSGPVFEGTDKVFGVGHCSFVKSPDDKEDWIIYHSKRKTDPGWDRDVRMQPFGWKADGTPYFGSPIPAGQPIPIPSGQR
ncbi:MAG: glycoside hydrolase family 43 protein [Marinilabiliales bacterium]|nr:glycoside hydrolase family 43 protein [Marinilabiliales bacterium]